METVPRGKRVVMAAYLHYLLRPIEAWKIFIPRNDPMRPFEAAIQGGSDEDILAAARELVPARRDFSARYLAWMTQVLLLVPPAVVYSFLW